MEKFWKLCSLDRARLINQVLSDVRDDPISYLSPSVERRRRPHPYGNRNYANCCVCGAIMRANTGMNEQPPALPSIVCSLRFFNLHGWDIGTSHERAELTYYISSKLVMLINESTLRLIYFASTISIHPRVRGGLGKQPVGV